MTALEQQIREFEHWKRQQRNSDWWRRIVGDTLMEEAYRAQKERAQ